MKSSLVILLIWASLCVVWNVYGRLQLANGGRALGPTATLTGAGVIVGIGLALLFTSSRWPLIYQALAGLCIAMAAMTIWNAFRLDPALWPSEFWRYAGIAVNSLGVLGGLMAIFRR